MTELTALGEAEHRRVLLAGIAEGRLLYSKHEQYQREPGGDLPQHIEGAGFERKGRGTLHGMESLIYESRSDARLERIEIAEDAPLVDNY